MANLLGAEFTTAGAMRNLVEGQVRGPGFHSNVYNTQWQEAGTGIFSSAFFFVEMFLGSASIVGAMRSRPSLVTRWTVTVFMNASSPRPPVDFDHPPVGNTWLPPVA